MTKNEIIKRLEELDRLRFMLMMIDHWDVEDRIKDNLYAMEERKLKTMLAEME